MIYYEVVLSSIVVKGIVGQGVNIFVVLGISNYHSSWLEYLIECNEFKNHVSFLHLILYTVFCDCKSK